MQRIGRYRLGRVLGKGGAGRVYEATMVGPGGFEKPVALKVLHEGTSAVRREARIGGLLRHRHLVDVFEVGEEGGVWFFAMERCTGPITPHLPLPPRAVVEVGLQVCEALSYAHAELGLVHLDLKPDNLLLTDRGEVKVADLGIARVEGFEDDARVRGTPGFMAPEQLAGRTVDPRADVYALGVTLLQLATGAQAVAESTVGWFSEEPAAGLRDVGPPTDPAGGGAVDAPHAPRGPDWLWPVVVRCLEPLPDDRFPDMDALAEALRHLDAQGRGLAEVLGITPAAPPQARGEPHLPAERDQFVGRERELARIDEALDRPGLVTLRGPAGVGKTRLALAAARRWQQRGRQAWFCDLTPARSLDGLLFALARVLDLPLRSQDAVEKLGLAIAGRGEVVLVLDNFEQLADLAPVLGTLRLAAPQARFVVTSRTRLGLADEVVHDLSPLGVDAALELLTARAASRGAEVADDPDLPELVRRLDGLPLALELAAGRLGVLTVRDVLDRLGMGVLRAGVDGRHGTLRAALDWSWRLLTPDEQRCLAQLSVFSGGWSAEAAEGIVQAEGSILDLLDALVQRSMVRPLPDGRLGLLESIREYAAEHLDDEEVAVRHGRWFAERWDPEAIGRVEMRGGVEQEQVARDVDNLVAACWRAVERGDGPVAVALLRAAWLVFDAAGPYAQAARLARAVVDLQGLDPGREAAARMILGMSERLLGHTELGWSEFEACRSLGRESGDRATEALALNSLAAVYTEQGRLVEARAMYEEALATYREVRNRRGEASSLGDLGVVLQQLGHFDEARASLEASLVLAREVADRVGEGATLANLGILHMERGGLDLARAYFRAALDVQRETRMVRKEVVTRGNLALVYATEGRLDEARPLLEQALAQHRELGNRRFEGIVSGNLGILHHMQGRPAEARACLERARDVADAVADRRFEGYWLAWLARVDPCGSDALDHLDRGEPLLRSVQDPVTLAELLLVRAEVLAIRGDPVAARRVLAEATEIAPAGHGDLQQEIARVRALLVG